MPGALIPLLLRGGRRILPAVVFGVALALVGGPALASGGPLDAAALVLEAEDLPTDFSIAGGDRQPDGAYLALYFRPEVLTQSRLPEGALLGVMAAVEVLADADAAAVRFEEGSDAEAILRAFRGVGPQGSAQGVERVDAEVAQAELSVAYRVEYVLQGIAVVDYRFRLAVGRAVANLMVSGRRADDGREPPMLLAQARKLAVRQAERLAPAAGGGPARPGRTRP